MHLAAPAQVGLWHNSDLPQCPQFGRCRVQSTADTYGHLFPLGADGAELAAAEKAFLS
jgi:hypothetical protein